MNYQIFMIRNGKYMILIRSSREIKQYYVQISVSGEFPEKKNIYIYIGIFVILYIYILCMCIEFSDTCCISLYLYICIFINIYIYIYILVYIYTSVYMFISLIIRFGGSRWAAAGGGGGDLAKRSPHGLQNR